MLQLTRIKSPFSVTVFEDEVFWSEMKTRTVQRMKKTTGKDRAVLIKRSEQPYGLKVYSVLFKVCPSVSLKRPYVWTSQVQTSDILLSWLESKIYSLAICKDSVMRSNIWLLSSRSCMKCSSPSLPILVWTLDVLTCAFWAHAPREAVVAQLDSCSQTMAPPAFHSRSLHLCSLCCPQLSCRYCSTALRVWAWAAVHFRPSNLQVIHSRGPCPWNVLFFF